MNSSHATPAAPATWYSGTVSRQLRPRRSLFAVSLTDGRARWHVGLRWILAGLAVLTALLLATEQHRICDSWGHCDADDWGAMHTLATDLGATPFFVLALVVALQAVGYRRRLATSVLTAIGSAVLALFLVGSTALAHLLTKVDGGGGAIAGAGIALLLSLVQIVVEPVLAAGQRKQLEATEPVFPRAAVVSR